MKDFLSGVAYILASQAVLAAAAFVLWAVLSVIALVFTGRPIDLNDLH